MLSRAITQHTHVSPQLDHAISSVFGDPIVREEENTLPEYKMQSYTIHRVLASCPRCRTVARHPVFKKADAEKRILRTLECVWCWSIFASRGRCR